MESSHCYSQRYSGRREKSHFFSRKLNSYNSSITPGYGTQKTGFNNFSVVISMYLQ